jgi:macrolide transport system ATP-binding/permease protein
MGFWKELSRRARYLGRRSQFDTELDAEIQFHMETRAEELQRDGVPQAEARARARREFGPRARMREDTRAAWQFQWLEDLWRDLSYAARAFAKSPGFTSVAVLSLAIGVGANCVMFSIVEAALLRQPRVPRPSEVVAVISTALDSNAPAVSYPDYADVRDHSKSFEGIAAFTGLTAGFAPRAGMQPRVKEGKLVSGNFFEVLRIGPEIGRAFLREEDGTPGRDVVILSHPCWERDFGSDPSVLGKQARINGIDFIIIGVLPARFSDVDEDLDEARPDFYLPLHVAPRMWNDTNGLKNRGQRTLTLLGRLRPGVPIAQARAEVTTIARTLETQYPDTNRNRSMTVQTVRQYRGSGGGNIAAGMVMTLAGAVLLVACANVAGLLTSRAPARARELAMRLAIGAGRPRLIRQLLTESMLLAVAGGVVGVGIGYIPIAIARQIQFPSNPPQSIPIELNGTVLLFSMAIALLSVILFGLMPAFQATHTDLTTVMKGDSGFTKHRGLLRRLLRGRNFLVAGQVAISLLLLTVSSLLYVGVYKNLLDRFQNPGFEVDHLMGMDFDASAIHYKDAEANQFFTQLAERLRSTDGVKSATFQFQGIVPIRPDGSGNASANAKDVPTSAVWTDEGFFDTMGIAILQGRHFQKSDLGHAPAVVVVNQVLARHYWPDRDAIGQQLRLADGKGQFVEVVGVAKIDDYMAFGSPPMDIVFIPFSSVPPKRDVILIARSAKDPSGLAEPVRKTLRDLDPDQALPEAFTYQNTFGVFASLLRLGTHTISAMGVLGLALALVGLCGLLMFEVDSRTREIGIRMALGAGQGSVVLMVLRQGIALAVCGIAAGVALNYGVVRLLMAIFGLGGNNSNSPATPAPNSGTNIELHAGTDTFGHYGFYALVLAVFVVTIVASYFPARRASRVDPNVALRCE